MTYLKKILLLTTVMLSFTTIRAQNIYGFGDGKHGSITYNGNSQTYYYIDDVKYSVTNFTYSGTLGSYDLFTIEVTNSSGAPAFTYATDPNNDVDQDGNLVLIIQMEGSSMAGTEGRYVIGRMNQYLGSGGSTYECEIKVPDSWKSSTGLSTPYFDVGGKIQILKIYEYENVTLINAAVLTCDAYDPTTGLGGVFCLAVNNTFDIQNGIIDVSAKGYPAGSYFSSNYGTAGVGADGATPLSISGTAYTLGGFSSILNQAGTGNDGGPDIFYTATAWSDLYLEDDGGCNYSLAGNYKPGDGGTRIAPTLNPADGEPGTGFPETDPGTFHPNFGPIYMGNCGHGGYGGHGGYAAGHAGGGAGSGPVGGTNRDGDDGGQGTAGHNGANGGAGGAGGGIVMLRVANFDVSVGYDNTFKYIRSAGEQGHAGNSAYDNTYPYGSYGQPGAGGDGADAVDPDYNNQIVYLPGRGGAGGQSGKGSGGGSGGSGGVGGSVYLVYNNTNDMISTNISVSGGNGGSKGYGGIPQTTVRGSDGAFFDLSSDTRTQGCKYMQYPTVTEDCMCDDIFIDILPNTSNWQNPAANQYTFEVSNSWTCTYNPTDIDADCVDGRRLQCSISQEIDDGTGGKAAPMQELTTIYVCDMKYSTEADQLWADLYDEIGNGASIQVVNGSITTIDGPNYDFVYQDKTLSQYNSGTSNPVLNEIESCCEAADGGSADPDDDRMGDSGDEGDAGTDGQSIMDSEDLISFKKATEGIPSETTAFELSPNPAGTYVELRCPDGRKQLYGFRLVDVNGKVLQQVETMQVNHNFSIKFELEGLPAGTYMILIQDASGNRTMQNIKFNKE